ncbi:MAG TPA: THUMP domain-containing protein [bacterium]|nr:THUMP domain-containing protein [bacterium]
MTEKFFAPCPRGLEIPLSEELRSLGAADIVINDGGVHFAGDWVLCYRANLYSRTASRILWKAGTGKYSSEKDIYDFAIAMPWNEWFDEGKTIRVSMVGIKCPLKSLNFAGLKIKDAICDKFRAVTGIRPSVDTHSPDILIHGFLTESDMTISIDTSGDALFKRGVRQYTNIAPIRENLAAGILMLAGWKPGIPLLDPMCGSGTFLIEAAQMSLNIAPGINRKFAFEKLKNFQKVIWEKIKIDAVNDELEETDLPIWGSDLSADALNTAQMNLESAGLLESVRLNQANILDISAPAESGIMVTNLPYGERMGDIDELKQLYPQLGDILKKKFAGWNAYLLTSDLQMPKSVRLAVSRKIPLFNGALECRLFEYKMVSGSNRRKKDADSLD